MNFSEDSYKLLHDVQHKCSELSQKIDSIIHIMEMLTTYMNYSHMMSDLDFSAFQQAMPKPEGGESMNPKDLQKMLNAAQQSGQQMSQTEFDQIFETMKQGKSPEEVARMEQMVQLAKSFLNPS